MTDETTETVAPDVADDIELLETGRVRLIFDGKTITLRTIKAGELKKLKRSYFETTEKITATNAADRADQEFDAWAAWLRSVVDLLGDAKLPTGKTGLDRLPGSWVSMNVAALLISHWQTHPLPRGVPASAS